MDLRSRNKVEAQAGMSSMTDLVFLLLIFFIIMSTLAVPQYEIVLPSGNVSEPLKDGYIDVAITPDNKYVVDNATGQPVPFDKLKGIILKNQKELIQTGGVTQARLRISADKGSEFARFNDLMVFAKQKDLKVVVVNQ